MLSVTLNSGSSMRAGTCCCLFSGKIAGGEGFSVQINLLKSNPEFCYCWFSHKHLQLLCTTALLPTALSLMLIESKHYDWEHKDIFNIPGWCSWLWREWEALSAARAPWVGLRAGSIRCRAVVEGCTCRADMLCDSGSVVWRALHRMYSSSALFYRKVPMGALEGLCSLVLFFTLKWKSWRCW